MDVHIFPEAMRGTGEGCRPFDLAPKSSMGQYLRARRRSDRPQAHRPYKGGERAIVVDPKTLIVALEPGAD
jgi:hypothetical protein